MIFHVFFNSRDESLDFYMTDIKRQRATVENSWRYKINYFEFLKYFLGIINLILWRAKNAQDHCGLNYKGDKPCSGNHLQLPH